MAQEQARPTNDGRIRLRIPTVIALALVMSTAGIAAGHGLLGPVAEDDPLQLDPSVKAGDVEPTRVVIGFHDGIPDPIPQYVHSSGGEVVMTEEVLGFIVVFVDPESNQHLIAEAQADPRVEYAELDIYVTTQHTPNDILWNRQWGAAAIKLMDAWDVTFGSHDVHIHILDTGIDHTHADLLPNLSPMCDNPTAVGWSTIGIGKPGGQESGFHGTHVAGIAGAVMDNQRIGVAGTSQSCLTSVQVLAGAVGLSSWVSAGIRWSANNDADVISMSLGSPSSSTAIHNAVKYADGKGVLQVAAAGNDWCDSVGYPAAYSQVMSVAALWGPTIRAPYSNCGPENEISAPGSGIWSTLPGNAYGPLDGTSMATPFVSGTAGLVWAVNATLDHIEVRCILTATAFGLGSLNHFGWGRLDADRAVQVAQDPVSAAQDPDELDVTRGVCPDGIFGT